MATEKKRDLYPEIAHRRGGQDITRGYVDGLPLLPHSDRVLATAGGWRGYDELLRDDQVGQTFDARRLAVISRPWRVDAGGERRIDRAAAELVRATLEHIAWDRVTDAMLYARFYGYAVAEILWRPDAGGIALDAIAVRDRARFGFAPDGSLRLRTSRNPNGEVLPERKFWVLSVGASHTDEPYGRGLAHRLYWPVYFKRHGARFWSIFLEKFGAPTVVGKFPSAEDPANVQRLLEAAIAVQTDAAVAIPENMGLALLEASRGGTASYPEWMGYWDAAIAKVVLGQTASSQGTPGRLGSDDLQSDVRDEIVRADADLISHSANASWVRWLIDLNLPGAAYPTIWRDLEDAEDLDARAERDVKLQGIGLQLTPEAIRRVYGDDYAAAPMPNKAAPAATDATPATAASRMESGHDASIALAEPDASRAPEALAERMAVETDPAWQAIAAQVRELVAQAQSLPALRAALISAYGDLPAAQLAEVMALGFQAAELAGRLDARADSDV